MKLRRNICPNPLAGLVVLLAPGRRVVGNGEPWSILLIFHIFKVISKNYFLKHPIKKIAGDPPDCCLNRCWQKVTLRSTHWLLSMAFMMSQSRLWRFCSIRRHTGGGWGWGVAGVCFELHSRVTLVEFWSAAAISLHRQLAILATSIRPNFSKDACLGILFAPMYQKYSLDFVLFGFYSNIQMV